MNNQAIRIQELEETARLYEKRIIAMQESADKQSLKIDQLADIKDALKWHEQRLSDRKHWAVSAGECLDRIAEVLDGQ